MIYIVLTALDSNLHTPFTLKSLPQRRLVSKYGVNRTNSSLAAIAYMEDCGKSSVEQKVSSFSAVSPWLSFSHWPGCKSFQSLLLIPETKRKYVVIQKCSQGCF